MRLLDVKTKKLHTFYAGNIPDYAILSHTWGKEDDEVSFAQIQFPEKCVDILGFKKIEGLCEQAARDQIAWAWIDTCAIDKSSSVELSEAINSMYEWYANSKVCYAYLSDVDIGTNEDFLNSRWWKRSWTLQELLAPTTVEFFDTKWVSIGFKAELAKHISEKTGIHEDSLKDREDMFFRSVAQRMSWASTRKATRIEDVAYSLLGIFRVNIPLQYGEGSGAFLRLQQEIMKSTNDQSLFAWSFSNKTIRVVVKTVQPPLSASSGHQKYPQQWNRHQPKQKWNQHQRYRHPVQDRHPTKKILVRHPNFSTSAR
jgi:Heterokaryon incompatibility protein (HET)